LIALCLRVSFEGALFGLDTETAFAMVAFFSKRAKSKKADELLTPTSAGASGSEVKVKASGGGIMLPTLDLDKAAQVIEARARGVMARRKTTGLKAHRGGTPSDENPLAAFLAKCMPCLQQK